MVKWETKPNSLRHVATCMATIFFDSYGQTCLKKLNFWPLFYKGSIQSMDQFLMTIELLFIYPLFYRQNGSVFFIMYVMNTSGIRASVNMKNWKGLPLKMTR